MSDKDLIPDSCVGVETGTGFLACSAVRLNHSEQSRCIIPRRLVDLIGGSRPDFLCKL